MTPAQSVTALPRTVIRSSGSASSLAVLDVGRTVAGPASYSTGGFTVDLSASYTSIASVLVAYANDGRIYEVDGTNFATGSFKLKAKNPFAGFTPLGTVAAPVFTGNAVASDAPSATTTVPTSAHTHIPTQRNATCVATCNCASGSGLTGTASMNATAGPSATTTVGSPTHTHNTTATGSNTAPAFTGTAQAALAGAEVGAGANLSASTVAYWIVGVPV